MHALKTLHSSITHQVYDLVTRSPAISTRSAAPDRDRGAVSLEQVLWFVAAGVSVAVIAAILKTGEAFFGGTTWRGRRAMRVSVCNWQTSEADVERVIAAVRQAIQSVAAS